MSVAPPSVTWVLPPDSVTTTPAVSLSAMVSVWLLGLMSVPLTALVSVITTVSSPSTRASSLIGILSVTPLAGVPALMTMGLAGVMAL